MSFFGLNASIDLADELDADGDLEVIVTDEGEIIQDWLTRDEAFRLVRFLTERFGVAQ